MLKSPPLPRGSAGSLARHAHTPAQLSHARAYIEAVSWTSCITATVVASMHLCKALLGMHHKRYKKPR